MKKNKQLTTVYFKKLVFLLMLAFTFACSNEEYDEVLIEENSTVKSIAEDNILSKATVGLFPCTTSGSNNPRDYTISNDFNSTGVSVTATIDDRTCTYNYTQETRAGINYGQYRLRANSNHIDNDRLDGSQLQPRIERQTKKVDNGDGSFVRFDGEVRIRQVADDGSSTSDFSFNDNKGTYFIQAKGQHTGGGGSPDPALLLLIAKPGRTGYFNVYSEEITQRGGSGSAGRDLVLITEVKADRRIPITMINGFNSNGSQYVNVWVNGVFRGLDMPLIRRRSNENNPDFLKVGRNAKIRFGAYRCKSGDADIWWSNVSQSSSQGTIFDTNVSVIEDLNSESNWDPANSITSSATMYSSSNWDGSFSPAKGADGNWNSRWASSAIGTSHYLLAQFSGNRVVKRAKVRFESAYSSDFILWGRYNGQWYNLARVNNSAGNLDVKIEGFYGNADAYSIHSYSSSPSHNHISIREFELYPN